MPQARVAADYPAMVFPMREMLARGSVTEVADGMLLVCLPLPFRLNHVNVYLIRDGHGWALLDTGIRSDESRQLWTQLFSDVLAKVRLTRVIVSHFHPDHIGLAGWLCATHEVPLYAGYATYMGCRVYSVDRKPEDEAEAYRFYRAQGMDHDRAIRTNTLGNQYLRLVEPLPPTFRRLTAEDDLRIGERQFRVIVGEGHAPEQIMLYCEAENLLFAADQVMEHISPNVGILPLAPDDDPLGAYLASLDMLRTRMPEDVFVMPGHHRPFRGLHRRCVELADHHAVRCAMILDACRAGKRTNLELQSVLFPRDLDPHQTSFAFSETLAHVNMLVRRKALERTVTEGVARYSTTGSTGSAQN